MDSGTRGVPDMPASRAWTNSTNFFQNYSINFLNYPPIITNQYLTFLTKYVKISITEVTALKKAYSLDYSIERDNDRVAAIYDILDQLPSDPTSTDLEQMANYILYGKDENGQNAIQRGEATNGNTRYNSFKTKEDTNLSLEAILDNPMADQQDLAPQLKHEVYIKKTRTIARPKYNKKTGELIEVGDSDIPGMQELWERIDHLEHWIAAIEGRVVPNEQDEIFDNSYRLYQLKHILIDLRRHQYYLKDYYKPVIKFQAIDHPHAQFYDWTADSFYWMPYDQWRARVDNALLHTISKDLQDYEVDGIAPDCKVKWVVRRHIFNWEDPLHVRALINNYELLYQYMHDKLNTYGYTLLLDFERYRKMAALSPVREYLLEQKILHTPYDKIIEGLQINFDLRYNENHLSTILAQEIPQKIAMAATKHRLILDTPPENMKTCSHCGAVLPRTNLFFAYNRSRRDGYSSSCKECERLMRIQRGGQTAHDKRSKESQMSKMQTRKA